MKEILFISDLHLSPSKKAITNAFLHFLQHRAANAQALYILGDLFDAWVGDDCITPWHTVILRALKKYSKKHPLYFIKGNRDFLVGHSFLHQSGCQLLENDHVLVLDGQRILLLHGDSMCSKKTYRLYRMIMHLSITRKIYFLFPPKSRQSFIMSYRKKREKDSQKFSLNKKEDYDFSEESIKKLFLKYDASYMIHGHTHCPKEHLHCFQNKKCVRWVLGDWSTYWWVLSYHQKTKTWRQEKNLITDSSLKNSEKNQHITT